MTGRTVFAIPCVTLAFQAVAKPELRPQVEPRAIEICRLCGWFTDVDYELTVEGRKCADRIGVKV